MALFNFAFTLEQVRSFLAVAEREHVTGAATALHISQGAVTQHVRSLERALGVRLLERVGRRVHLTDAGRAVAEACRGALRGLEGIEEAARAVVTGQVGTLHLGASQTAAAHYLDEPLAAFVAVHPGVDLRVTVGVTSELCDQVTLGSLDCALVEDPLPRTGLTQLRVAQDEVIAVARPDHPLAGAARLSRPQLAGQRYLARESGSALELLAHDLLGDAFSVVRQVDLGSLEAVRSGVLAGLGFAVLPRVAVASDIERGALAQLPLPSRRRLIRAVRRPSAAGPALEHFWGTLRGPRSTAVQAKADGVGTEGEPGPNRRIQPGRATSAKKADTSST